MTREGPGKLEVIIIIKQLRSGLLILKKVKKKNMSEED
jgi:hypothetical protein